ncbi:MAG: beta-lactamase family protein [Anaerolineales bacterium]|nr:MAG: beta-lactamase family protein [Anaerolineales bacterium]
MDANLDAIVRSQSDHPKQTGLVVGVLQGGQRSVYGYGTVGGAPPAGDTLFEIGSVTKVFTTALLSILAAEKFVNFDDPLAGLASELENFPRDITLLRLATHTSGLPKMPANLFGSMLRDPKNPYAAYSSRQLLEYLSRHPPEAQPLEAQPVVYSNLGMGLLGTLLARQLGGSYEGAINSKICQPLGMQDTCIQLTEDHKRRLAEPHNARGKRSRNWDLPAFAGAGALKSTADDLLTFLSAHLGEAPEALAAALQDCHAIWTRNFAPPGRLQRLIAQTSGKDVLAEHSREGMALCWTVSRLPAGEVQVHWHHGATGGYRAFAGFVQESAVGVVVLTNSGLSMRDGFLGSTATDRLGFKILEQLTSAD